MERSWNQFSGISEMFTGSRALGFQCTISHAYIQKGSTCNVQLDLKMSAAFSVRQGCGILIVVRIKPIKVPPIKHRDGRREIGWLPFSLSSQCDHVERIQLTEATGKDQADKLFWATIIPIRKAFLILPLSSPPPKPWLRT